MKNMFCLLFVCVGFAFAKAQQAQAPAAFYKYIHPSVIQVQTKQWDYYLAATHASNAKAQKLRKKLIKEIEKALKKVNQAPATQVSQVPSTLKTYLIDLLNYHAKDYDLLMNYDIPRHIDSETINAYVTNANRADAILRNGLKKLETELELALKDTPVTPAPFYKSELHKKLQSTQGVYEQSHLIYATFNTKRANQLAFLEALNRQDLNAAMQLLDAMQTDVRVAQQELSTNFSTDQEERFLIELRNGLSMFKELTTNLAPEALATAMRHDDERVLSSLEEQQTTLKEDEPSNFIASDKQLAAKVARYLTKLQEQGKRLNQTQRTYVAQRIPKK